MKIEMKMTYTNFYGDFTDIQWSIIKSAQHIPFVRYQVYLSKMNPPYYNLPNRMKKYEN